MCLECRCDRPSVARLEVLLSSKCTTGEVHPQLGYFKQSLVPNRYAFRCAASRLRYDAYL